MTLVSSGMLGSSLHALIFRHHVTHTILVTPTEYLTMPTSTPVLGALKAEKPAHTDKEAIQRNHSYEKDATQAPKKYASKKKAAAASSAASEAKQSDDSTGLLGERAGEEGCGRRSTRPESVHEVGSTLRPKTGNASAALTEAKPSPWQQRASAKPSSTSTSPGQAALVAP